MPPPPSRRPEPLQPPIDGRYNSDQEPEDQVVHITRGYSRDHRPDLNQVMLELIVEHQAGIPVLMQPLRGNSSAAQDFGEVIRTHVQQLHLTYGMTYLVADSALYSAANLQKLAQTHMNELTSLYGGVQQRWILIYSAPRQTQPQRTVDQQWRKQSDKEAQALKQVCDTAFACEADARQALAAFAKDLQATFMTTSTVRAQPRYGKRGRPRQDAQPDHVVYTHVLQPGGKAVRRPLDPL